MQEKGSRGRSNRRLGVGIMVLMLSALMFFIISDNFASAQSLEVDADQTHKIAFTQQEVALLLTQSIEGALQAKEETEENKAGATEGEENAEEVNPADVLTDKEQAAWVTRQLEGKVFLLTKAEEDGCISFVAFDTTLHRLFVVSVNNSDEEHAVLLELEHRPGNHMTAVVNTYPVIPASSKEDSFEQNFGETEEIITYDKVENGVPMVMLSNGAGIITVDTGLLYGGRLSPKPSSGGMQPFANITSVTLQSGAANVVGNAHGLLRIYSHGDPVAPAATGDFATYSLDNHTTYYDVDSTSQLTIAAASPYFFKIEMRNTSPVALQYVNTSSASFNITLTFQSIVSGSELNITNASNPGVSYRGILTFDGTGIVKTTGTNGIFSTTSIVNTPTMNVQNGFQVEAKGSANGISVDSMIVTGGSKVTAEGVNNGINCTGRGLGAKEASEVRANATGAGGVGINSTASSGEIYADSLSLIKGEGAVGIKYQLLVSNQIGAAGAENDTYSTIDDETNPNRTRIIGFGSDVGIQRTANGSSIYCGKGTLIYGRGVNCGIMATEIEFGGSYIYGIYGDSLASNTSANGTFGRPALSNRLDGKQYGTIIAYGTGPDSDGFYVNDVGSGTIGRVGIYFGTRLIAVGGRYGVRVRSRVEVDMNVNLYSEVFAYGISDTGWYAYPETSSNIYTEIDNRSKVYTRGDQYGFRSVSRPSGAIDSCLRVYGTRCGYTTVGSANEEWGSKFTAIGGIGTVEDPFKDMDNPDNPLCDPTAWLTTKNLTFEQLPEAFLDERGLPTTYRENTAGVSVEFSSYIAAYDRGTVLKAFGGDVGGQTANKAQTNDFTNIGSGSPAFNNGTYLVSYEGARSSYHGYNYGGVANTYIHCWSQGWGTYDASNANIDGKGGNVRTAGILTGNSVLKGYGRKYGLLTMGNNTGGFGYVQTLGDIAAATMGRSYIYGYGEISGIKTQTANTLTPDNYGVSAEAGSMLLGETIGDAEAVPGAPEYYSAIDSKGSYNSNTTSNVSGFIHELYTVKNYNVVTMPPYQLNTEIPALQSAMGSNSNILIRLNWTTPENAPNRDPDPEAGRDWLDYDANNDQKLVKPGTVSGTTGLIAYGSASNATLVGQTYGTSSQTATGISPAPKLTGTGKYRITIRGVHMQPRDTMNININLKENFEGTITQFSDSVPLPTRVPLSTLYKLTYRNIDAITGQSMEPKVEVDLNAADVWDRANGKLHLYKLRLGEYWLEPKTQAQDMGYPYTDLPTIHFYCKMDTEAPVPPANPTSFYPNYADYWYAKVFLSNVEDDNTGEVPTPTGTTIPSTTEVLYSGGSPQVKSLLYPAGDDQAGKAYVDISIRGDLITDGSGTHDPPTMPGLQGTDKDVQAFRVGEMNVYYFIRKYDLDFELQDIDTHEVLPGSFTMTGTRNGTAYPSLTQTLTGTTTAGVTTWNKPRVYAGVDYKFAQVSVTKTPYLKTTDTYTAQLGQDGYALPVTYTINGASTPAASRYYASGIHTDATDSPYHYVRAYNDLPSVSPKLHLIDEGLYLANSTMAYFGNDPAKHLTGGMFKLEYKEAGIGVDLNLTTQYLTDNGDGTFTLVLKPRPGQYVLTQTAKNSSYYIRTDSSEFVMVNVTYNGDNTAITGYEIGNQTNPALTDTGWVEPTDWNKNSIWITNKKATRPFSFIKVGRDGSVLPGAAFVLYPCTQAGVVGHVHDPLALTGSCWNISNPIVAPASTVDGLVDFGQVVMGDYMLVEIKAPSDYALPSGQWLVGISESDITMTGKYRGSDPPPAFKTETKTEGAVVTTTYILPNYRMSELPKSGNNGILIPTILGTTLVALILLAYWLNCRRKAKHSTPSL